MPKKYLVPINLAQNELQNAKIQNLAAAPSSPVVGQAYFDTTLGKLGVYDGGEWDYMGTSEAAGDVSSNTATSVDSEVALFSGTGGKTIKRATGSGIAKLTSGVLGTAVAGTDYAAVSHEHALDDLSDVAIAGAGEGDILKYSGTAWENSTVDWGMINGTLSDQSDLQSALDGKSATGHTHTASNITDFSSAADARISAAAGVSIASLSGGVIPTSQLPALSLTDVNVVASQAAQLALTAQEGDVAVRSDLSKSYIHNGGSAGTMADWTELATPTDAVTSVNGQTGIVVLGKSDVGLGNVDNTSDANKPVSTAQQTAIDARLAAASNLSDVASAATAFGNIKQAASDTATGVVELATVTEAEAKTDTARAVTPAGLASFTRKYSASIGDGAATSIAVTHSLGTKDVISQVRQNSDDAVVECDIVNTSTTVTTFSFAVAPATNALRVVIQG